MATPKEVVFGGDEEEVKSEGLEIVSIGYLYNGPWEKKYWSSSRGKDRYPYPVGYQAVQAHNGSTSGFWLVLSKAYNIFMQITSSDAHSCSGQTPDIAWEKFQKKHCPRMKTWHGKRLSCKIDGVEFFGFKNSFVQRLLRELVADINGAAERNLLSSSFCNGASSSKHDNQNSGACAYPDFQPYLQRAPVTKKRSRKNEVTNRKPVGRSGFKKPRPANEMNHKHECSAPPSISKGRNEFHKTQSAWQPSVHLNSKTNKERDGNFSAKDGFPSESIDFSVHLAEGSVIVQEVANSLIVEEKPVSPVRNILNFSQLDRSKNFRLLEATEDVTGDAPVLKDSPCVETLNLCAPDTLDFVQVTDNADNTMPSSPSTHDKGNYSLKEDFTTANNVHSERIVADSHAEEEIGTSNSNASFGKGGFDSVGQEITEAMMTVLLPKAIPLLNNVSRKEKANFRPSETSPIRVNLQEGKNETSLSMKPSSPAAIEKTNGDREEKLQNQDVDLGLDAPIFENSKSFVLDSFEDDQHRDHITNEVKLSCNIVEADEPSTDKDINLPSPQKDCAVEDARNESFVYHVETSNSKNVLSLANMDLDKMLLDRDACISESVLDCRSSSKEVFSKKVQDNFANLNKNSTVAETHPVEKDLKNEPESTEGANDADTRGMNSIVQLSRKDIPVKVASDETGSPVQVPHKVYSRKVSKRAPLMKKFDGPFSESIICRNFIDDHVAKQQHTAETLLASEISQMRSSDYKPQRENFDAARDLLEVKSCCLPVISKNSTVFCATKDKDFRNSFDPSTLHMKKSKANSGKELDEQVNFAEFNSSVVSQKQEISGCENTSSNAKESQVSSDLKLQKNVESINELAGTFDLMGCYFFPLPILSVLLSTTGDKIYVCVSCGFLVDKKRTLFIYTVDIQEPRVGNPSCVGHTSVMLPFLKDNFGREIALERSCALFTPDGQYLVLLDSMKTPYCREGRSDCLCSTCTSHRLDENAVKIVKVKPGYVSVVAKLKTDDCVQCILVCKPKHLIAVGESGKLHLWEMNSSWSAQVEECIIPINDCIYPCIVEMKRIPKCAPLVLGHNGFGEFGICWQRNGSVSMDASLELTNTATTSLFSKHSEKSSFCPSVGEDSAIWLLVSTISDSDAQHNCMSRDCQKNPVRFWRLALLVKNRVILGSPLDPRASAIGASSGLGIIGTNDGLVYAWELSSGNKLGILHHFKGGTVSCIATDDSGLQALAVAGDGPDGGQLLVYLHAQENIANQ
ncbi:FYR C-terminal domain-containing protein [Citrus sinensis]|uniref:FYR C-terminal domain-containing protein n=1 Tax=Citrus sinensis TaxID=2711 RepID=A0ACB8LGE1_CITSI|nr:FYR C-terminal domain-containing protein [Citrus sinensis]